MMTFIETFLIPFALGVFTNIQTESIKKLFEKMDPNNVYPLKNIFVQAFIKTLQEEKNFLPNYSKNELIDSLIKEIKNDDKKLFSVIEKISTENQDSFLNIIEDHQKVKFFFDELFILYNLDASEDIQNFRTQEFLSFYKILFFDNLTAKESNILIIQEVLKINKMAKILSLINDKLSDFDKIREIVLSTYVKQDLDFSKKIDDYDKYLLNKFKFLELAGFSPKISGKDIYMELSEVFIPLYIQESGSRLSKKNNDLNQIKKQAIEDILQNNALVILGDPGAGKSTLLKYIATHIINMRKSDYQLRNIIPVFVKISDFADYYKKHRKSLYDFIVSQDSQYKNLFQENFEYSNLLLLLDGLDEITDASIRSKIISMIIDLKSRYPNNKYIVTSRIIGYRESSLSGHFKEATLQIFNKYEIQQFAKQWYASIASNEIASKENLSKEERVKIVNKYLTMANDLYHSISRNPSVLKFATNPLLMTIVAMIFYQSKKLPNKRVELYDIATETFLDNWVRVRFEEDTKFKDKSTILEILPHIAFELHRKNETGLISEKEFKKEFISYFQDIYGATKKESIHEYLEFKDFLEKYAGFFYRKDIEGDLYGFVHLTFEEYLSALELTSKWGLEEIDLSEYMFDARWIEVLRLAAASLKISNKGKLGRVKATSFIKNILNNPNDVFPDAHRTLQLTLLILADDVEIETDFKNQIIEEFISLIKHTKNTILVSSLSSIFNEILFSNYRDDFLSRIKKEMEKDANKNLALLLVNNSDDKEILNYLLQLLESHRYDEYFFNEDTLAFYNEKMIFLKEEKFIASLRNYIIEHKDRKKFSYFMNSLGFHLFSSNVDTSKIIEIYQNETNQFMAKLIKNQIYKFAFQNKLSMANENEKFPLEKDIQKLIGFAQELDKGSNYSVHYHDDFILFKSSKERAIIDLTNLDMIKIERRIPTKLIIKNLDTSRYSKQSFDDVEFYIDYLKGPEYCEDKDLFFTDSIKKGKLLNFLGWENYIFDSFDKNVELLSDYILNNAIMFERKFFLSRSDEIGKDFLIHEDLNPVVRLILLKQNNQEYNQSLINDCIDYYNALTDENIKTNVFYVLFNAVNPF